MLISPIIFFGILVVLVVLFASVVYFAYFGKGNVKRQFRGGSYRGGPLIDVEGEALRQAQEEAEEIVKTSVEKAQEMLADAQYIKDDLVRSIESSMKSSADEAIVSFQDEAGKIHSRFNELFSEIREKYLLETQKVVEALEKESKIEAEKFRATLQEGVVASQKRADARADEAFQAVKYELDEYKKGKIAEFDERIKDAVGKVFSEVMRKSITPNEHEKLMLEALEEAKKGGVLRVGDTEEGSAEPKGAN